MAVLVIDFNGRGLQFEIPEGKLVVVGNMEGFPVTIPHSSVAGRHARIGCQDGRYWVQDLGSPEGTFVNEERVGRKAQLFDGASVRFGESAGRFFLAAPESGNDFRPPIAAQPPEGASEPLRERESARMPDRLPEESGRGRQSGGAGPSAAFANETGGEDRFVDIKREVHNLLIKRMNLSSPWQK